MFLMCRVKNIYQRDIAIVISSTGATTRHCRLNYLNRIFYLIYRINRIIFYSNEHFRIVEI